MKTTLKARWSTLAVAVAAATTMSTAVAQELRNVDAKLNVVEQTLNLKGNKKPQKVQGGMEREAFQPTRFLIEFVEPAVATYKGGIAGFEATSAKATGKQRLDVNSHSVESYATYLRKRQANVMAEVKQRLPELKEKSSLTLTFNGVIVEYKGGDLKQRLRGVPGIKAVHEDAMVHVHMDASNDLIGAPEVWQQLGGQDAAGKGINVAIIDTGLDFDHPMFADNGHDAVVVESEAGEDWCAVNPDVCNDKIAIARYFDFPEASASEDEVLDSPWDVNGHGSHVAGTAVGNPVSTTYNGVALNFSGVAPGATLMVYKALFNTPDGRGSGLTLSLAEALESAAADGADVINNSWGGGAGGSPANSYYTPIMQSLDEMGVITVTSAGNSGPGPVTVGCPGCIEETITVASTQTGRVFGNELDVTGFDEPFAANLGNGAFEVSAPITAELWPASQVDEANVEACTAFEEGAFEGKIALVTRGTCSFEEKANVVQDAGAVGMVLYNNADGEIIMTMGAATLPSVSIQQAAGLAIEEAWDAGMQATINPNFKAINEAAVDIMSGFSSRGPNGDSTILKPEIAAPGSDILSAAPGQGLAILSGTSMASPHVAGAAALVLASYGDLTPKQVRSILMTSSKNGILKEDGETPADAFDVGAGRVDLPASMNVGVTFDTPSFANNMCVNTCSFTRELTNLGDAAANWQASVSFTDPNVSATFTESVALEAGGTGTFEMEIDGALAGEGWQFGHVTFTDASGTYEDAVLPVAVYTALSEDSSIIAAGVTAGELLAGTEFTMSAVAALVGTGEEVTLSVQYPTDENFVIDDSSLVVTENLSTQTSSEYNAETRSYTWVGTQQKSPDEAVVFDASADFPFAGLGLDDLEAAFGIPHNKVCVEGCDETYLSIDLTAISADWRMGGAVHTDLFMWDNGFVEIGEQRTITPFMPGFMPDDDGTNGVVAPLWSDFMLVAGESEMRYTIVNAGAGIDFLILEWYNVQAWTSPDFPEADNGERYTFNAWFLLGTNEVYYNYIETGTESPYWGSAIGIEDTSGTVGQTVFYAYDGAYPADGGAYGALIQEGANGTVQVDLAANVATFGDVAEVAADGSHSRALAIDLTAAVGEQGREFLTMLNVSSGELSYDAVLPMHIKPTGTLTAEATAAPENGTLSFDGLTATYTPPAGWVGTDSFSYRVVDEDGGMSTENTVAVEITNAAPAVNANVPSSVGHDEQVRLDASATSDADGDSLTYQWQLVNGPTISLANANTAVATFTAPRVDETSDATFLLTVSDGLETVQSQHTVTINKKDSSSFGWLLVLLGLPLVWLRRRTV